jgi:hypothetical protein
MTKKISKKLRIVVMVVAAILVAIVMALLFIVQTKKSAQDSQQGVIPTGTSIQIQGEILCLPHKDTTGPQTMECAYGIKDDKGQYYGLRDGDPGYKNVSGHPMNTHVEVTGIFKKDSSSTYPTIGTIEVTKITSD